MRLAGFCVWLRILPALAAPQTPREEIELHYRQASEAMRLRRLDQAALEFREILRIDATVAEAHANLGVVYYMQHRYLEASKEFREALKLKPPLATAENLLGMSMARTGRMREALPLLEKSFQGSGDRQFRQETGLLLLQVYDALRRSDQGLDVLRVLEREYPSSPEVLYTAYRMHSGLASKAVAGLVQAAPDSARVHEVAGELLESEGDFPHAAEQYRLALQKDPDLAGGHRALGLALMNASADDSSLSKAQKEFELALAADPGDAHSEYQLGEISWRRHQPEEALRHYSRAAELRPAFTDALIALGKLRTFQGQPEKALPLLQEAIRIDPNNEVAHYRLAQAYRKLGQAGPAEQELAEFRKIREASASISAIYQQVQRKPITGQTIESSE